MHQVWVFKKGNIQRKRRGKEEQKEEEKKQIRRRGVGAEHQTAKRRKKNGKNRCALLSQLGEHRQRGRWRATVSDVRFDLKTTRKNGFGSLVLICLQCE